MDQADKIKNRLAEVKNNSPALKKIRQNLLAIRSGCTPSEMSARLRDLCNENGYDPVYELMDMIRMGVKVTTQNSEGETIEAHVPLKAAEQIAIHKEMIKYIYPTLKAVDIQGHIDANVSITVKSYTSPANGTPQPIEDADFSMVGDDLASHLQKEIEKVIQN